MQRNKSFNSKYKIADYQSFFYLPTDAQYLMLFIPMCGARGSAVG
jgi:hypothetical protein